MTFLKNIVLNCCLVCSLGLPALVCTGCTSAPAGVAPEPPKVTVQHPEQRELVDYDEYNGRTAASAMVEVRARVRGHVDKVCFADGDLVKKDALLFELDPRPFQSEVDRAVEQVRIAEAQQEVATKEEDRQRQLFERQAGTVSDLEKAVALRKSWDAQVASAKEEVKRRELELTYARITSPIDGKISRALLTEGNLVNAGGSDPLLTTIVSLDPIHVYFAVDERALLEYRRNRSSASESSPAGNRPGESQIPFEFRLETDDSFVNKGVLDFADNQIDSATGTIEVRGTSENADGKFLPGSRVRVRVPVSEPYTATVVPDSAVLSDQDKKYVLCLNEGNNVIRRDVRLGRLLDDGMRVILPGAEGEGVTSDDRVIVLGLQRARINYPAQPMDKDGQPVGK